MKRPLLLGHRGLRSFSVRENTIPAFELALQHGCDGFEFDVRLTADVRAVICHGPKFAGIRIAGAAYESVRVLPTLEDVLARCAGRAFLDIELKVPGIESCVVEALSKFQLTRGYVVSSFLPTVLVDLRKRSESVPLGIICETLKQLSNWRELPAEYVILHERLINPALIADLHSAGKKIFTWTINRKGSMIRLADLGVDGIISDKTELLVATLGAR